jgi:hypothetical protein
MDVPGSSMWSPPALRVYTIAKRTRIHPNPYAVFRLDRSKWSDKATGSREGFADAVGAGKLGDAAVVREEQFIAGEIVNVDCLELKLDRLTFDH